MKQQKLACYGKQQKAKQEHFSLEAALSDKEDMEVVLSAPLLELAGLLNGKLTAKEKANFTHLVKEAAKLGETSLGVTSLFAGSDVHHFAGNALCQVCGPLDLKWNTVQAYLILLPSHQWISTSTFSSHFSYSLFTADHFQHII